MISQAKKIIFFGSTTATTGTTLSEPSSDNLQMNNQARKADFLLDVKTLGGGTTPSLTFSIQEGFADNAGATIWAEAATITITATGKKWVTYDPTGRSGDVGSNPGLGAGNSRKVVITASGSPTGVSADVYEILSR
jgi:hypothetical protein